MRVLAGSDAYHLLEERPAQHMHTIKVVLLEPARAAGPTTLDDVRAWVNDRLLRIPPLRWRARRIPFGLGRPVFVDQHDVDLDYHVQYAALGGDATDAALDELVSRIASEQLDADRPLWQLWLVDGLARGLVALVFKMHHAIADGGASVRILEEAFGLREPPPPAPRELAPSKLALVLVALRIQLMLVRRLPRDLAATLAVARRLAARRRAGQPTGTPMFAGPPTRFNEPLSAERAYANVTVPLADLRRVKDALGGSLNDVYIALCGGALRRYLDEHQERPLSTLTATSPVGVREDDDDHYGNVVSVWYVTLATDTDDPRARVAAVRDSTTIAREITGAERDIIPRWQDRYAIYRLMLRALTATEALRKQPMFNATVSNVKGPPALSWRGAPVVALRSLGPLVGRQGLNFTAWSYRDDFAIGVHACRAAAPDLPRLAELVHVELDDMLAATHTARPVV